MFMLLFTFMFIHVHVHVHVAVAVAVAVALSQAPLEGGICKLSNLADKIYFLILLQQNSICHRRVLPVKRAYQRTFFFTSNLLSTASQLLDTEIEYTSSVIK